MNLKKLSPKSLKNFHRSNMNNILGNAVYYSKEKISTSELNLTSYVTTDSLLANKKGKCDSVNLPPNSEKCTKFKKGDILVANIRPYLKKIWFADIDGGCSADVLVFKTKEGYLPSFIYYALLRDDFFIHSMKGSTGTKMPRGNKDHLLEFLIPDFDSAHQEKISKALSLLDAKIILNNKINSELEAMAKLIYDYWFVQFDFPDENGKPYKSTGGKMVYNEDLKREIPEGWEVTHLSKIAKITMGQSPNGSSYNIDKEGAVFFQGCTDFGNRFPEVRIYTTEPSRFAKSGDILMSVRAPVGTLNIADVDCCIGRGLAALNSKDGAFFFLLNVMTNFKKIFDRRSAGGTTFGAITKSDLHSLEVVRPHSDILKLFVKVTSDFQNLMQTNHRQNLELTELRDWLLPMLMNGQVTVSEAS